METEVTLLLVRVLHRSGYTGSVRLSVRPFVCLSVRLSLSQALSHLVPVDELIHES